MNKVVVFGAGGHARVVIDCLQDKGVTVAGVFDAKPVKSENSLGAPYLGNYDSGVAQDLPMIIAIGDNLSRKMLSEKSEHKFATAIHPSASVSPNAIVSEGTMILHRAILQTRAIVGKHVILNTGSQVDHDCVLGAFVHIGPGAVLCGSVTVGEGALVGAGAVVTPGINIGNWAIVGAGAVVIENVPDHATVVGSPARIIKEK